MLEKCNRGLVIGHIGGSNCIGNGTAISPLLKPANVTYWRLGINTGTYPTLHGMVPGFTDELVNVLGVSAPITIVERGVNTTNLTTWIATHGPAFITDCATAGVTPNIIVHDFGAGDAQTGADLNKADDDQDTLYALFRGTFGGGCGIFLPQLTVVYDAVTYVYAGGAGQPGNGYGIWDEQREYCQRRPQLSGWCDTRDLPTSDTIHRTGPAQDLLGRRIARTLYNAGVLG